MTHFSDDENLLPPSKQKPPTMVDLSAEVSSPLKKKATPKTTPKKKTPTKKCPKKVRVCEEQNNKFSWRVYWIIILTNQRQS